MTPRSSSSASPDRGTALLEAARRSIKEGHPVAGRALIDAVRAVGVCPDALDELDARLMLDEGRTDAAIELADAALERNPHDWRMHCVRSDARLAGNDLAGAAADAAEAVVAAPHEAAPKAALGVALLRLGHLEDARACLADAVAANPVHVSYRLAYARALAILGEIPAARATLEEAITLRPSAHALRTAAIRLAVGMRDFEAAIALAERARRDGVHDACILGLHGHALSCLGRDEMAVVAYRAALQLAPEDSYVRHLVASAGLIAAPDRASPEYVRALFDGFADHFEADLIQLDYRVPGLIRAALLGELPHAQAATSGGSEPVIGPVLDLGCGTGLVAVVLSDLAVGPFVGVDLSPGMLAEAAAKHLYEQLVQGDVCDERAVSGHFGLAVAADVLPYLGDPGPILAAAAKHLVEGGLFILTIESLQDADLLDFRLGARARYAHRSAAFRSSAGAAGFTVRSCLDTTLRLDRDGPVAGCVLVLRRSGGDAS